MRLLYGNARGSIVYSTLYYASPAINTYDEYGIPAATNTGRFQYTGQAWLPELGMYYYKARLYSPALGRFMQTDPIGYEDGLNIYAYVGNDPVNGVDFDGKARVVLVQKAFEGLATVLTGLCSLICPDTTINRNEVAPDSSAANEERKETKKERKERVKKEAKERKANEKMPEKEAKKLGKRLGPEKRRELHDMKEPGEADRSREQFKQDLEDVAPTPPPPPPRLLREP